MKKEIKNMSEIDFVVKPKNGFHSNNSSKSL